MTRKSTSTSSRPSSIWWASSGSSFMPSITSASPTRRTDRHRTIDSPPEQIVHFLQPRAHALQHCAELSTSSGHDCHHGGARAPPSVTEKAHRIAHRASALVRARRAASLLRGSRIAPPHDGGGRARIACFPLSSKDGVCGCVGSPYRGQDVLAP